MRHKTPLTPEALALAKVIEDRRRAKARGRIAKLLAKKRGDLRRMPLTGRAALAAIRAGKWAFA